MTLEMQMEPGTDQKMEVSQIRTKTKMNQIDKEKPHRRERASFQCHRSSAKPIGDHEHEPHQKDELTGNMKQIRGKKNRGTKNPSSWRRGGTSEGSKPPLVSARHTPNLRIEEDDQSRRGCEGDFARSV